MTVHILHIHSTFAHGGKEARAVRLMNAFGDAARHTIVSAMPDQLGAREAIAPGIRYEIAQDPPSLVGRPSVARYDALSRYMSRFDLVLTYNWGAMDAVMAGRTFGRRVPPIVHHEDGFNADEADGLKPQRNMYRRVALGAVRALIVPSQTLEEIALETWKQPRGRVHRIPNGVPVDRYAKRPKADALGTGSFLAHAFDFVRFVLLIVAFEEVHAAVAFKGEDVRCDAVQEPAIVTRHEDGAGKFRKRVFERAQRFYVEIV